MTSALRQEGTPVAVQLTSIVPVRVFNPHGDYFDTEVDLDVPLRSMQLAIEDYFKIKPEVQLLLHNRQQIHAERSLRDNGCLLLKGDPYVKIVCAVKRGPVLNLLCEVGQLTYVVACHESSTVWEVKKMLCDQMTRQQQRAEDNRASSSNVGSAAGHRLSYGPERLRLLWRYLELNDKATLHYYRVPTNAVFQVMHRKRAAAAPPPPDAASTNTPRSAPPTPFTATAAAVTGVPPALSRSVPPQPTVWWQRPPVSTEPPQPHVPEEYNDAFENLTRRAVPQPTGVSVAAPPSSVCSPPSVFPPHIPAYLPGVYESIRSNVTAPPPPEQLPQQQQAHYDPLTSTETVRLALRVRDLEEQLRALWQALQEQRQIGEYQRGSLADTHQRILELQEQMEHVLWLQQETARLIPL